MRSLLILPAALSFATSLALAQSAGGAARPGGAAVVSAAQFRDLRWIVGRWRGVGAGPLAAVGVFYEEYEMVDDSTMRMRTAADSTFRTFTDSTRFELRGGTLRNVPARGTGSVVTRIAGDSIQWSRTLYLRVSNDRWRAIFPPRAASTERPYYELRRIR